MYVKYVKMHLTWKCIGYKINKRISVLGTRKIINYVQKCTFNMQNVLNTDSVLEYKMKSNS